jgi:TolA-binding protein
MRKELPALFLALSLLSSCSPGNRAAELFETAQFEEVQGNRAAELFETAQFEEVQNNQEHAKQLYSEIIAKYPESEYAKKAKERLSEL